MDRDYVQAMVHQSIITVRLDLNIECIKNSQSITDDLGFDSMALVNLASELEHRFKCSLPLTEWVHRHEDHHFSVESLIDFLSSL